MNNKYLELAQDINLILKENKSIQEYNKLKEFLDHDEYFLSKKKQLKELKKLLQEEVNYTENRNTFLKIRNELKDYPPYHNYLYLKEELNDLFNEINDLLSIK